MKMSASLYTNHFDFKVIPCGLFIVKTVIVLRELYWRFWPFCQDAILAETKCNCGIWKTGNFSRIWPGQGSLKLLLCRFLVGCSLATAEVSQVLFPSLLSEKQSVAIWGDQQHHQSGERNTLLSKHRHHLGYSSSFKEVRTLLFYKWVGWDSKQSSLH